jgi:hypothetical protein
MSRRKMRRSRRACGWNSVVAAIGMVGVLAGGAGFQLVVSLAGASVAYEPIRPGRTRGAAMSGRSTSAPAKASSKVRPQARQSAGATG